MKHAANTPTVIFPIQLDTGTTFALPITKMPDKRIKISRIIIVMNKANGKSRKNTNAVPIEAIQILSATGSTIFPDVDTIFQCRARKPSK